MTGEFLRRFSAVLVAVLVVCSFAAPAAAVVGTDTSGDGLSGVFNSEDSNESGEDDGGDGFDEDSESTEESEEADESDGSDESDENEESDDTSSDEETDDAGDDGNEETTTDAESDEDDGDRVNRTRDRVQDAVNETEDTLNRTTNETGDTVESVGDAVNETTSSTASADAEVGVDTVASTGVEMDGSALKFDYNATVVGSNDTLELDASDPGGTVEDEQVGTLSTISSTLSGTLSFVSTGTKTDNENPVIGERDADDNESGSASDTEYRMAATTGGDGEPLPAGQSGGAALGLGVIAAAAAARSTPLFSSSAIPAVGSLSAAGFAWPTVFSRLRPFFFPLRYSRYDDSDPLEHEARSRVYEIINDTPGAYLSELSEEADLPLSTTRHHIKVLEREDLVSGAKLRGKRRFYPAYSEGLELAAALNDDSTAAVLDTIGQLGAASVSDLADELDRDPSTISHHLQRLEEDEIILREREGRAVMNRLSPEARTALEPTPASSRIEAGEALAGGAD